MARRAIVMLAAACLLSLASSSVLPPFRGELRTHFRNLSPNRMAIYTASVSSYGHTLMGLSAGCEAISVPWTLSVGPVTLNDLEHGDYQPILDSGDFADAASVELWVEVTETGKIQTGQGHPEWSETWPSHCGPFSGQ